MVPIGDGGALAHEPRWDLAVVAPGAKGRSHRFDATKTCASRPRWQHAKLVARQVCVVPPRQLAPVGAGFAAAALGNACRDFIGMISGLKPGVELQPVLRCASKVG